MGNLIAAAKRLQDLTGGLVLLVHHTGKDTSKGLRGHSSLYAALDGAIEVSRPEVRREWSVAKSKDDETGQVHPFRLEQVTVGVDDDGEDIMSCVVVPDDTGETARRTKLPQGGNQKIALDTLGQPLRESKVFNVDGAPPGHPCIRLEDALLLVAERLPCEPKRRTERAQQALNGLVAKNICGVKDGWLWRV
jgi:putative DNA primase/helicase